MAHTVAGAGVEQLDEQQLLVSQAPARGLEFREVRRGMERGESVCQPWQPQLPAPLGVEHVSPLYLLQQAREVGDHQGPDLAMAQTFRGRIDREDATCLGRLVSLPGQGGELARL